MVGFIVVDSNSLAAVLTATSSPEAMITPLQPSHLPLSIRAQLSQIVKQSLCPVLTNYSKQSR